MYACLEIGLHVVVVFYVGKEVKKGKDNFRKLNIHIHQSIHIVSEDLMMHLYV